MKKGNRHLKRIQELGFTGTVQQIQKRTHRLSKMMLRSVEGNWKRIRKISDREMLQNLTVRWENFDSYLAHLCNRSDSSYLFPTGSPETNREIVFQRFPDYASQVIHEADEICVGRLNLLGHSISYPAGIPWNKDPLSDFSWPLLHRETMIEKYCWAKDRPRDLLMVWELNRHQHFVILGIAYFLTGDEKYTDTFISHLKDWIQSNPTEHGINWTYSLEVSVRVIAWIIAFQFFRKSHRFHSDIAGEMIKCLFQQVSFVDSHPQTSWTPVPNNHILTESAALVVAGVVFPEFRPARVWKKNGLNTFLQQLQKQTHTDGVNREQAMGYHRIIAELLIILSSLGKRKLIPENEAIDANLEKMLDYVLYSITPDGSVPLWGDADFGRMLGVRPAEYYWDFRPLLAAGAVLLNQPRWRQIPTDIDPEIFWLLGKDSLTLWDNLPPIQPEDASMAFPDAGIYCIRDGWESAADAAFFRCGAFGLGGAGFCSHAHCDLLSVQLWLMGKAFLVDSGTYTYHGEYREKFRSTAAHSTWMIDHREQATPKGDDFNWVDAPHAVCSSWDGKSVTGVMKSVSGLQQSRKIKFIDKGYWVITDNLKGTGEHEATWFFHFAPGLTLKRATAGDRRLNVMESGRIIAVMTVPPGLSLEVKTGWYSDQYAVKIANTCLMANWKGNITTDEGMIFPWEIQCNSETKEKVS